MSEARIEPVGALDRRLVAKAGRRQRRLERNLASAYSTRRLMLVSALSSVSSFVPSPVYRAFMRRRASSLARRISESVFDLEVRGALEKELSEVVEAMGGDWSVASEGSYSGQYPADSDVAPEDPLGDLIGELARIRAERSSVEEELSWARKALAAADADASTSEARLGELYGKVAELSSALEGIRPADDTFFRLSDRISVVQEELNQDLDELRTAESAAANSGDQGFASDLGDIRRSLEAGRASELERVRLELEGERSSRAKLLEEIDAAREAAKRMASELDSLSSAPVSFEAPTAEERRRRRSIPLFGSKVPEDAGFEVSNQLGEDEGGPDIPLRQGILSRFRSSRDLARSDRAVEVAAREAAEAAAREAAEAVEAAAREAAEVAAREAAAREAAEVAAREAAAREAVEAAAREAAEAAAREAVEAAAREAAEAAAREAVEAAEAAAREAAEAAETDGTSEVVQEKDMSPGFLSGIAARLRASRDLSAAEDLLEEASSPRYAEEEGRSSRQGGGLRQEKILRRREAIASGLYAPAPGAPLAAAGEELGFERLEGITTPHEQAGERSRAQRTAARRDAIRKAAGQKDGAAPASGRTEADLFREDVEAAVMADASTEASAMTVPVLENVSDWVSSLPDAALARLLSSDVLHVASILENIAADAEEDTRAELVAELGQILEEIERRTEVVFKFSSNVISMPSGEKNYDEGLFGDERDDDGKEEGPGLSEKRERAKEKARQRALKKLHKAEQAAARKRARSLEKVAVLSAGLEEEQSEAAEAKLSKSRTRRASVQEEQSRSEPSPTQAKSGLSEQRRAERDLRRRARDEEKASSKHERSARKATLEAPSTGSPEGIKAFRSKGRKASLEMRAQDRLRKVQLRESEQEAARMRRQAEEGVDGARKEKIAYETEKLKGEQRGVKKQARSVRKQEQDSRRKEVQRVKMLRHQAKLDAAVQRRTALNAQEAQLREEEDLRRSEKELRTAPKMDAPSSLTARYGWEDEAGASAASRSTRAVDPSEYDLPEGLPEQRR